jgi:hypothetical protein
MWTLMQTALPPSQGRLRIPVVNTQFKHDEASMNKSQLELFIEEHCVANPEGRILYKEFKQKLNASLSAREAYTAVRLTQELGRLQSVQSVKGGKNRRYVEGLSWDGPI